MSDETVLRIFGTAATCDRADAGVGVIWWSLTPWGTFLLRALDYDLSPMPAVNGEWIEALFRHGAELIEKHRPRERRCVVWCEPGGLLEMLRLAARAWIGAHPDLSHLTGACDIGPPDASTLAKWPPTLDARAAEIRPLVN